MKKYLLPPALFSALALAAYYLDIPELDYYSGFVWMILFFFVQSAIIAWIFTLGEKDSTRGPIYFLGGVALRFVTGIIFLMIIVFLDQENMTQIVIQFGILYLVFLVFELIVALSNLRRN